MGLSFGEIVVLAIVALVVIGPKDLPRLLRTAGRVIGQGRRLLTDVKRETGLDEILRGDFRDLERLADHLEADVKAAGEPTKKAIVDDGVARAARREREYPSIGADAMGLLPEDAAVYANAETYVASPSPTDAADEPRAGEAS